MKEAKKCLKLICKPVCKLSVQCAKCTVVNKMGRRESARFPLSVSEQWNKTNQTDTD